MIRLHSKLQLYNFCKVFITSAQNVKESVALE